MARRFFAFGPFTLDSERETLFRDGRPVDIGHRALAVLHALLNANGQVVTKAHAGASAASSAPTNQRTKREVTRIARI